MLQNGHYEIDCHCGGQVVTKYVYRARELSAAINCIVSSGGTVCMIREVEQ
jgi:hypothetical protein